MIIRNQCENVMININGVEDNNILSMLT